MKLNFKVNKRSAKNLAKKLDKIAEEVIVPVREANERTSRAIIKSARLNLKINGTDNTGRLRNAIQVTKRTDRGLTYELAPNVDYALGIEEGTPPHKVKDFASLEDWAKKKLGNIKLAYPVSFKIAKEGTDPQPFWYPAIAKNEDTHIRNIKNELKKFYRKL